MILPYLCFIIFVIIASLAQLVEQLIRNEQVVGSSPMRGSNKTGGCLKRVQPLFIYSKCSILI